MVHSCVQLLFGGPSYRLENKGNESLKICLIYRKKVIKLKCAVVVNT